MSTACLLACDRLVVVKNEGRPLVSPGIAAFVMVPKPCMSLNPKP